MQIAALTKSREIFNKVLSDGLLVRRSLLPASVDLLRAADQAAGAGRSRWPHTVAGDRAYDVLCELSLYSAPAAACRSDIGRIGSKNQAVTQPMTMRL